jgi:hypothetical protein
VETLILLAVCMFVVAVGEFVVAAAPDANTSAALAMMATARPKALLNTCSPPHQAPQRRRLDLVYQ